MPFPENNVTFELRQSLGIQRSQVGPYRIDMDPGVWTFALALATAAPCFMLYKPRMQRA